MRTKWCQPLIERRRELVNHYINMWSLFAVIFHTVYWYKINLWRHEFCGVMELPASGYFRTVWEFRATILAVLSLLLYCYCCCCHNYIPEYGCYSTQIGYTITKSQANSYDKSPFLVNYASVDVKLVMWPVLLGTYSERTLHSLRSALNREISCLFHIFHSRKRGTDDKIILVKRIQNAKIFR